MGKKWEREAYIASNPYLFYEKRRPEALKQESAPEPAKKMPSTWLLWRNHQRLTEFRSLTKEEFLLIELMLKGKDFANLCDYLVTQHQGEDISPLALEYLLRWVDDGILIIR